MRPRLSFPAGATLAVLVVFSALPQGRASMPQAPSGGGAPGRAPDSAPGSMQGAAPSKEAPRFTTLPGFSIERVVPADKLDSYVAFTFDSLGRLVVSKENDHPRLLLDQDKDGVYEAEKIVTDKVRNCQGLWFDGRTLYGACAPGTPPVQGQPSASGLYKMTDTDGDDLTDTFEQLSTFVDGIQEHGPHAIRRGPDGVPTIMLGNNTFYPDAMVNPRSPLRGTESQFLPALPDGRGFGPSIKEGLHGTIARIDERAKQFTLLVGGLRNAYDHAFNLDGEVFTFDSDMEWDINMPWYRDVRSVHGIPGGNYGYRNGSGKFPPYYVDALPPLRDLGRGSPVGVEFYQHHVYPKEFHDAYFEADWSRGRLLWTPLVRTGATYKATKEKDEFVHGEPLNITDVETGPDGFIYFTVGGRLTEGGLYRVRYSGPAGAQASAERREPGQAGQAGQAGVLAAGVLAAVRQPQPLSSWGYAAIEQAKAAMGTSWGAEVERFARDGQGAGGDRAQAVYILQRHGPQPNAALLKALIADKEPLVRAAAVYVVGAHSSDAAKAVAAAALKDTDPFVRRRAAEALVRQGLSADAPSFAPVADIYSLLSDSDRFVRWSGRAALERTPRSEWQAKALNETNVVAAVEAAVALIDTAPADPARRAADLEPILKKQVGLLQRTNLSVDDTLRVLRAFQLAVIAARDPNAAKDASATTGSNAAPASNGAKDSMSELRKQVHGLLIGQFPSKDDRLNRELAVTLAWAGQPAAIAKILAAMPSGDTHSQLQLHYVYALRTIPDGWTREQKDTLTDWYAKAATWRGGASFPGFINLLFDASLRSFTDEEKKLAYAKVPQFAPLTQEEIAAAAQRQAALRRAPRPQSPGISRTRGVLAISKEELAQELIFTPQREPPSIDAGRQTYEKACASCHRFGGIGTDIGPDLTTLNSRFQKKDIVEAILWPSKTISDQYDVTMIETMDGKTLAGFVVGEQGTALLMRTADTVGRRFEVPKAQVKSRTKSPVSMMPDGLVDEFSLGQIAGLIRFLQAPPP